MISQGGDTTQNTGPRYPHSFHALLQVLLQQFAIVFNTPTCFPPPRPTDYRIPLLPNSPPVNVRPFRHPHFQKSEIKKLVGQMLLERVNRPSTSPFSSPLLLVRKNDGSWGFYIDYRALNAITIRNQFPIPTIDKLLDELVGATVFSKLDMRADYHQLWIHPSNVEKTAFRTHDDYYEFTVMSFGLSNAPSTF